MAATLSDQQLGLGGATLPKDRASDLIRGSDLLKGGEMNMRQNVTAPPAGPAHGHVTHASNGRPVTGTTTNKAATGIAEYAETLKYAPPADLDKTVPQPGMPRANKATTTDYPSGHPDAKSHMTVLQQHVAFWDRDKDGVIYPWDTFVGFRRLGFGLLISTVAMPVIHGTFSYPTQKSWIPNPLLPIYMDRMHRTKHGSDSEVFDTEGRFVPEKFEEIFSKFDRENKGGLAWKDIQEMVYTNMNVMDFTGWIAERLEWWVTYLLLRDHRGIVSKDKIRGVYDGTIWEQVAAEVEARKGPKWE